MSNEPNRANIPGHGDYERRDVGTSGVLYFLGGLLVAGLAVYFIVNGIYAYLNKRFEAEQTPVSPLITNAPVDTRHIPPQFGNNYERYLKNSFPAPQLEIDERTELNSERLHEEDVLSTYGWVDQKAGTVRIPIDRAMDLIAQRGLPVRPQASGETQTAKSGPEPEKGTKK
jgi:hypothetical protein